jgi:TonB family protein
MAPQKRIVRLAVLAALAAVFVMPPQIARGQDPGDVKRKIKSQVQPTYPEIARRMNIHGKVKLEITIAPDGTVKNIRCMGGHPLLVTASQDAVAKWKYEAGPKETTLLVEVNFD